ncbi:solute carrier family 43 member 3-like [Penaeus japonicus]|uniref:solute carrier family 43 member 3-like n=1 Tax=Penaeus japonicus TaxID=27405 RepID=UPI001C70F846|nr:solute carrier family 43 member 3-like [Penaeus japonicus]
MFPLCTQPRSVSDVSRTHRWLAYIIATIEAMLWSGPMFGWASLVHVLKTMGVYSHLCRGSAVGVDGDENLNATLQTANGFLPNSPPPDCAARDQQFALIYTASVFLYGAPGFLIGYCLHHLGLAFTRVVGGSLMVGGFVLLSFTSQQTPSFLWGAAMLLSIGANTSRMAGLQLANFFPKRRDAAMSVISGLYTPSAALFIILQYACEAGYSWTYSCLAFAGAASFILLATPLMPRHHVPYTHDKEKTEEMQRHKTPPPSLPLQESLMSISSFLYTYWLFSNLYAGTTFSINFNSWINKFSRSVEETAHYSRMYGYANIMCIFSSPLPSLLVDAVTNNAQKGKSGLPKQLAIAQAMAIPLFLAIVMAIVQDSMLLFQSSAAVYVGLVFLIINRPTCFSVGNPFVRIRFPADHFNRMIGIQDTVISIMLLVQYPYFTWAQHQYYLAMGCFLVGLALSFTLPLHLCSKKYLSRVLQPEHHVVQEETAKMYQVPSEFCSLQLLSQA